MTVVHPKIHREMITCTYPHTLSLSKDHTYTPPSLSNLPAASHQFYVTFYIFCALGYYIPFLKTFNFNYCCKMFPPKFERLLLTMCLTEIFSQFYTLVSVPTQRSALSHKVLWRSPLLKFSISELSFFAQII